MLQAWCKPIKIYALLFVPLPALWRPETAQRLRLHWRTRLDCEISRFFVALAPMLDLLLCAKHLFVGASGNGLKAPPPGQHFAPYCRDARRTSTTAACLSSLTVRPRAMSGLSRSCARRPLFRRSQFDAGAALIEAEHELAPALAVFCPLSAYRSRDVPGYRLRVHPEIQAETAGSPAARRAPA
jgi:hypothetical protein